MEKNVDLYAHLTPCHTKGDTFGKRSIRCHLYCGQKLCNTDLNKKRTKAESQKLKKKISSIRSLKKRNKNYWLNYITLKEVVLYFILFCSTI